MNDELKLIINDYPRLREYCQTLEQSLSVTEERLREYSTDYSSVLTSLRSSEQLCARWKTAALVAVPWAAGMTAAAVTFLVMLLR